MEHLKSVFALGRVLWEQLVALVGLLAEAGVCHGRDGGLGAGGRERAKEEKKRQQRGRIIKIRSN